MYNVYPPPWMYPPPSGDTSAAELRRTIRFAKKLLRETENEKTKKKEIEKKQQTNPLAVFALLVMFSPIIGPLYGLAIIHVVKMMAEALK